MSRFNFANIARYPAPARLGIFLLALLLLWLPIATLIYWVWGTGNTVSITTLLVLYGEFVLLLRFWGQNVHQQTQPLKSHGLARTRKNWLEMLKGLGIGFFSLFCLFLVEGRMGWLSWQPISQFLPKIVLEGLAVALGISFAEELLFRGWLVDELRLDYGFKVAVRSSSIIYAALHFIKPWTEILRTLPSFPGLLLLGLTLGLARQVHEGRLGFSIGLHAGLVWGYYLINVSDWVIYTDRVPTWVTGIDQNPIAGMMGLFFLGAIAIFLVSLWQK